MGPGPRPSSHWTLEVTFSDQGRAGVGTGQGLGSPHCPSVLLANLLKGTSTEKIRPLNMTWTPSSGMLTYILMPIWETTMPSLPKPGRTTLPLKMI